MNKLAELNPGVPRSAGAQRPQQPVAYLINQYPKVSHSFIRREILALERQGLPILRIAVRGWGDVLVDPADQAERAHACLRG